MSKSKDTIDMSILKTGSCQTVTGKSKLTYQLATDPDDRVHIRVHKNSGGGFFSDEWIALDDVLDVLAKVSAPITAISLHKLFKGKSVNTPGFLLAVLVQESLLRPMKGKKRNHEALDPEGFTARIRQLVSGEIKPKGSTRKTAKKVAKKASRKKPTGIAGKVSSA